MPLILLCLCFFQEEDPIVAVYEKKGAEMQLRHEIVVSATRQTVWDLFTSKEGVTSWITPVAWIDLRDGGIMETSYEPNAKPGDDNNIQVRFDKVVAPKWYRARNIKSPANTPFGPVLKEIPTELHLAEHGEGQVRVTIIMKGWQDNETHNQVRAFFMKGNSWYLNRLKQRLAEGPLPFQ